MPIGDRDYARGEHPPNCTCVECVNRRLGIVKSRNKDKKKSNREPRQLKSRKNINLSKIGRSLWGKLKRLLILIALLAVATIVVVTVCRFITNELKLSILIVYIAVGLALVIWCLRSISKHRLSFTRIFLVLLISGLFSIVSYVYLDIRSFQDVGDAIKRALSTDTEQFRASVNLVIQRVELKLVEASSEAKENIEEGISEVKNTEKVYIGGAILVGADGHHITLKNNHDAVNPSWEQLKKFLLKDQTDSITYDFDTFVCADYAEMLHNNAEAEGIRAAYVSVWLGPSNYFSMSGGHALNAFETVDKGLIFIDCTGFIEGLNADKVVDVQVGKNYIPRSIFPEPGWSDVWDSMGEVKEIETVQY